MSGTSSSKGKKLKLLAIETASPVCGVALLEKGEVVASREEVLHREHAEKLPDFCKEVLQTGGVTVSQLSGVAVSIGPGSFTGLRIGLSFAKGIAFSGGLPIVPVPTLLAMADQSDILDGEVEAVLFSHKEVVYSQRFSRGDGRWVARNSAQSLDWGEFVGQISRERHMIHYGCGHLLNGSPVRAVSEVAPSARAVGRIAVAKFEELAVAEFHSMEPDYISSFKIGGQPVE